MAMEAGAAPPLRSPTQLLISTARTAPLPPLHPSAPPNLSSPVTSNPPVEQPSGEICEQPHEPVHAHEEEQDGRPVREKEQGCSKIRQTKSRKKESGEACEEPQRSKDVRGAKRSLSRASESSRAAKVARTIDSKVVMTQLKAKRIGRKLPPIISGSPMLNMIARKKAQTSRRSPNRHARSPISTGTLKSPSFDALSPNSVHATPASLHALSPIPGHGTPSTVRDRLFPAPTHGSKRRPRKLTSIIWKEAEPIYIDGFLMKGQCNYCNNIFPASKVSGTSQLARHLKVCEIKCSMDGLVQQMKNSDEIDPDWKFDQENARIELLKLVVFETLQKQEPSYTFCPSDKEWEMVLDICQLLKVFCHATNVISGSNYPTSNLYFLEIWSVKVVLDEQEKSSNATIRIMVKEMKKKFHKYFLESYLTNCVPVVLDPRFKMELVELRLKKYFGVGADKHIQEVKEAIMALFLAYGDEIEENINISQLQEQNGEEAGLADDALSDFDEHVKLKKAKSHNELQRYLEEDFHPRTPDFDILKWWAVNSPRYPILGNIARDVLAVPASTVASESAFSTCGRVITDHRTSLGAESVEALMCYGDWIRRGEPSCEESKPHVVS